MDKIDLLNCQLDARTIEELGGPIHLFNTYTAHIKGWEYLEEGGKAEQARKQLSTLKALSPNVEEQALEHTAQGRNILGS